MNDLKPCEMDDYVSGEIAEYEHNEHIYHCSACCTEFSLIKYNEDGDTWCEAPKYCPECGAKVVEASHE